MNNLWSKIKKIKKQLFYFDEIKISLYISIKYLTP